jgi:hypothetical protein
MTTSITPTTRPTRITTSAPSITSGRDRAARIILGLCAVGALAATAVTAGEVVDAEGTVRVAETWRLAGLPVFAGLFVVLAAAPRRVAGLWELIIANKIALVVAGATYLSGVEGGSDFVYVDGALVILVVTAYVLSRGWTAWSRR